MSTPGSQSKHSFLTPIISFLPFGSPYLFTLRSSHSNVPNFYSNTAASPLGQGLQEIRDANLLRGNIRRVSRKAFPHSLKEYSFSGRCCSSSILHTLCEANRGKLFCPHAHRSTIRFKRNTKLKWSLFPTLLQAVHSFHSRIFPLELE